MVLHCVLWSSHLNKCRAHHIKSKHHDTLLHQNRSTIDEYCTTEMLYVHWEQCID